MDRYGVRCLRRAFNDASAGVGPKGALVFGVAGVLVAAVYAHFYKPEAFEDIVTLAVLVVIGVLVGLGAVFVVYLLMAPARMEADLKHLLSDQQHSSDPQVTASYHRTPSGAVTLTMQGSPTPEHIREWTAAVTSTPPVTSGTARPSNSETRDTQPQGRGVTGATGPVGPGGPVS